MLQQQKISDSYIMYGKPYKEGETETKTLVSIVDMVTEKNVLQRKTELLEAITIFFLKKRALVESIHTGCGIFPTLRVKAIHDIEILHRSINRLWKIYTKL